MDAAGVFPSLPTSKQSGWNTGKETRVIAAENRTNTRRGGRPIGDYVSPADARSNDDRAAMGLTMVTERTAQNLREADAEAAVAEFIRRNGVTRCPTACVLPTQGSVAAADQEALEEHAARRDRLRKAKIAARVQGIWSVEAIRPTPK